VYNKQREKKEKKKKYIFFIRSREKKKESSNQQTNKLRERQPTVSHSKLKARMREEICQLSLGFFFFFFFLLYVRCLRILHP
jgi:hypothetical protein